MFYDNYIQLCNNINKSPSAVAEEIGFKKSAVTSWKNGRTPTDANARKIAEYFGITFSELMGKKRAVLNSDTVSEEAHLVALAYDQADEKSRAMVRLALNLDAAEPTASPASDKAM